MDWKNQSADLLRQAAPNRDNQPIKKQNPPNGVMGPSQRGAPNARA